MHSLSATLLAGFCPKQSFHIDWLSSCAAASDWERKGNRSGCWSYLAMIRTRIRTRMMRMGLESDGDLGRKNPTARIFRSCESGRTAQQLKKGKLCSLRIQLILFIYCPCPWWYLFNEVKVTKDNRYKEKCWSKKIGTFGIVAVWLVWFEMGGVVLPLFFVCLSYLLSSKVIQSLRMGPGVSRFWV